MKTEELVHYMPGFGRGRRARDLRSNYRIEDGHVLIEMELRSMHQFFNTFDPSPFYGKDIDADAEEYIVDATREINIKSPLRLVIYLPEES